MGDAVNVFEKDLRHHQSGETDALPPHHLGVLEILRSSYGPHEVWSTPALPDEPRWVGDVVWLTAAGQAVTAGLQAAEDELKWIKRSRLFRTSRAFWRATGTGPVLSSSDKETAGSSPAESNGKSFRAGTPAQAEGAG